MWLSLASWPGSSAVDNEDYVAAAADTVVVLDGVTPLVRNDTGCRHGVAWYVRALGLRLLEAAADPARALPACLAEAIRRTTAMHAEECAVDHADSPAATVAMVRVGEDRVEYLVLADATVVIGRTDGRLEPVSDRRAEAVGQRSRQLPSGTTQLERHRWIRSHRNQPNGYFVAAADPGVTAEAVAGEVAREATSQLSVATDGATRPMDVFGVCDWSEAIRTLQRGGAEDWLTRIREWERCDPDRVSWPRGKVCDDATVAILTDVAHPKR